MLPVCSATTSCSSHLQISLQGGLQPLSSRKALEVRCILEERLVVGLCQRNHPQGVSFKTEVATSIHSNFIDGRETTGASGFSNSKFDFLDAWNYPKGGMNTLNYIDSGHLNYVATLDASPGEERIDDRVTGSANILPELANPQTVITGDFSTDEAASASDMLTMDNESLSRAKTNIGDIFSGVNESISASVNKGESAMNGSFDKVNSLVTSAIDAANKYVNNAFSQVNSSVDQIRESANNKLVGFSNDLNEVSDNVGVVSVDLLRRAIVQIEDSLNQGAFSVAYSYGSAKELLPPEVQNVLNLSEERVLKVLRPVGTAFGQIYSAVLELEKILGLDPNDPIVHLVLFVGTSATLWVSYLSITYGGYAGDLSPKSTLELLTGKDSVVLVDVRPENLRERDGIPDLRRDARFRYISVTLPEVDYSVKKLMRSGKDLDDTLIAFIIRNLKTIQDRSKVVVMDADGTRSKGIARSLRKIGVKRPYLVQGGFRSWVKEGLRTKELKPETALTILNEEAEAILEDINPTPLKVFGYGVSFGAALYALLEWEKTLQVIGIIGLSQSIYRRVASYENAEDFKQDVRLLFTPVRVGGQAISWAAGKLETNGIGLPTSPSSSDVQNRVLQAAAKHESQPSDGEENQDASPDLMAPVNENIDLSEA